MPHFRVHTVNKLRSTFIQADTIEAIVSEAKRKLELAGNYKVLLDDGRTPVDDDFFSYATANPGIVNEIMILPILSENAARNARGGRNIVPVLVEDAATILDIDTILSKISVTVRYHLDQGTNLIRERRLEVAHAIRDYMMLDLNDTTFGTARKITGSMCSRYPTSFSVTLDNNQWNDGADLLLKSVYNGIIYEKGVERNAANPQEDDSDDEEIDRRRKQRDENRKNDEYGCAEYAPRPPNGETPESQENKRKVLLTFFTTANPEDLERVKTLMIDTYSTQRTALNKLNRDLQSVFTDWPFLKEAEFVILHASKLLGKNINSVWNRSVNEKFRPIRIFMKIHLKGEENMAKLSTLVRDCKQAMRVVRSHAPKFSIVIPLLALILKDKSDLYKLIPADSTDEMIDTAAPDVHPILIVVGDSIHQAEKFYVIIEKLHRIKCNTFLHGILVTFISYYVFGYFLEVNPQTGTKKSTSKKRKVAPICGEVLKLAKKLEEFTSKFQSEDPSDDDDENRLNNDETIES
ncbi:hypothetical protein QAD02_021135 [Eretmocerus hayati]|uniref:Uncharacterized protein n=1 Tax=Eretmocerus hayati TaxID=131215 RepID=A0ACC2PPK7_9HYME|nr:hypothetical protein QAD02_021135 [Eretmocerus hayati]